MRWFKHLADASDDEFILSLEARFGLDGYARWWKLLEAIAARMKPTDTSATASLPRSEWLRILKCKRKQLDTFLESIGNERRIILSETGNILQIECPKLLKFRDEYARKSGHSPASTPDNLPAKIQSTDTENREQRKKTTPSESKKKGSKDLVEEFELLPKHREWAAKECPSVPIDLELEAWKDRERANGYTVGKPPGKPVQDPQAAFYTAMRNAEQWGTYRRADRKFDTRGESPLAARREDIDAKIKDHFGGR
jgi:hypothetical protein